MQSIATLLVLRVHADTLLLVTPLPLSMVYISTTSTVVIILILTLLNPRSNLEFPQLKAHSNIGGIKRVPPGRDEFYFLPGQSFILYIDIALAYPLFRNRSNYLISC
jgi:hypothetical protein